MRAQSGTYAEPLDGMTYSFSTRNARYIKDCINGSNINGMNHWVEIEAYSSVTTYYVGNFYEVTGGIATKFYYAGAQRIALKEGSDLYYLLGDHLGSTTVTAEPDGDKAAEIRYKPFGKQRYHEDPLDPTSTMRRFTGQRLTGTGLYFYNSRWFDPALGRFIQPDTIVPDPGNPLDYDRYAYVRNAPTMHKDPSGHCAEGESSGTCATQVRSTRPNPVALTEIVGDYDGVDIREVYEYYRDTPGWWNDDGNKEFTVADLVGLWLLFESQNKYADIWKIQWENLEIVFAQNMYVGAGTRPHSQMDIVRMQYLIL